jgi:hypothetical protein
VVFRGLEQRSFCPTTLALRRLYSTHWTQHEQRRESDGGQYFINYNLKKGFYIAWQPIITANWKARNGDVWTVPVGGGFR